MKKILIVAITLLMTISAFSQKSDKGVFDNAFYARVGYAIPGGDLKTSEAITAGATFEVGTIFYINALTLPEKMKLGLDVTYVSISGFANQKMSKEENKTDSYFQAGAKLGPCFSYNFADEFIGDLYFKLYPNMFGTGEDENHGYSADGQFKLGTSFGLNLRWKALMLGVEMTSNKYDFYRIPIDSETFTSGTIKLPATNLTLGVKF